MSEHKKHKKRKHEHDDDRARKKIKKEKKRGLEMDKGKEKEEKRTDEEFIRISSTIALSIPPIFASSPLRGATSILDSLIMRYIPSLEGVLLSHSNLRFCETAARMQDDCPFAKCTLTFDAIVWAPRIGMKLSGLHSLSSPSHLSLLLHQTFNVSIPSTHIPSPSNQPSSSDNEVKDEMWVFEPGEAPIRLAEEDEEEEEEEEEEPEEMDPESSSSSGRWVSTLTSIPISGLDGLRPVKFTVIGMTIANNMLSLIGSLQPDPFDPRHDVILKPSNNNTEAIPSEEDEILPDAN